MVEGKTAESAVTREQAGAYVPAQRAAPVDRRHRAPSLVALVDHARTVIRRESLPPSGYIVVESNSRAKHQHAVWLIGPFAVIDGGWFGQVHGHEPTGTKPSAWLRKHERRCHYEHWTQFRWIDPAQLEAGCGPGSGGIGLSADGPTYCPGSAPGRQHPEHVPLIDIFTEGLTQLGFQKSA